MGRGRIGGVAAVDAVLGDQEVQRGDGVVRAATGHGQAAGLIDAHGQQHRVMARPQLVHRDIDADVGVQHELDPALDQAVDAALNDALLQLEAGDAVGQQAARAIMAVIDGDLIAFAAQTVGGGYAGGT
ncbi:hypothetical protein D3C72_1482210 [compost metagenome]